MSIYCYHKQKSVFLNSVYPTSSPFFKIFHYLQKSEALSRNVRVSIHCPPFPPARWSLNGCKVLEP